MKNIHLLTTLLLLFTLSCSDNKFDIPITIIPFETIDRFSDTTYFNNIGSIQISNNYYYFSDYSNSRIVKTNNDLTSAQSIGGYGEGPNEFKGVSEIFITNDNLYAFDDGNGRVHVYLNDMWVRSIKVPTYGPFLDRFIVDVNDSIIVYAIQGQSTNIIIMDLVGKIVNQEYIQESSQWDNQTFVRSSAHILKTKARDFIVIPLDQPKLFIYNNNWILKRVVNLENYPILSDQLSIMRLEYPKLSYNTTIILFDDAYLDEKNNLYLLTYDINSNQDKEFNIIMKFVVEDDSIIYQHSYKLISENKGGWYSAFAVYNDTLVAAENSTSEIQLFNLND